jgi:DNA repair protein RecO
MSYHLYQTEGLILGSVSFGEANKYFYIFTKDLGFVRGNAQSVRLLQSKLRYILQDFSYISVTLVRGKDSWRITTVGELSGQNNVPKLAGEKLLIFARVSALLRRLLHGEEKNQKLFEYLKEAYIFLADPSLAKDHLPSLEYILVLRLLHSLGYLGASPDLDSFVESPYWSFELINKMASFKQAAILQINKSLSESHL